MKRIFSGSVAQDKATRFHHHRGGGLVGSYRRLKDLEESVVEGGVGRDVITLKVASTILSLKSVRPEVT